MNTISVDSESVQPPLPEVSHDRSRSITLVLPAWNEQAVISQAICEADVALSKISDDYEILVVDDGSTDATAAIVASEALLRPAVRLLQQPTNQGYGAALALGFRAAKKELVAFTDSDCQFDLGELRRLISLAGDYDMVCGYRIDRQDPLIRKVYSGTYNAIVRTLLGTRVRDSDCALKVFRRSVIQAMEITTTGFFVNSEILTKARLAGHSVIEVGVTHRPRPRGVSTVSLWHIVPTIKSILRFWWNTVQFPAATHDDVATGPRWPYWQEYLALALLLVGCVVVMLPNLSYPLIEPDETRYVQIAIEMFESRDWITPTLDGQPYLDKPPLLYWLTAASFSVFGNREYAARLPSVLAALGTILLTYWLGRRIIGSRAAWCGAIALLLCGGFVIAGRFLIIDSLLTLFTTACLLSGYIAIREQQTRRVWWMISGVACALAVLAKGPVALVICAPPLIANGWLRRDQTRTRLEHWIAFTMPMLLVCVPWYLIVWKCNEGFAEYFFWEHNVMRFAGGSNHQQPMWFYLPIIFAGMFPTSLLLPSLGVFLVDRAESKRRIRSKDLGFLFCGSIWILAFFSLSKCKLPTYILPAMPLICLMLGGMLDHTVLTAKGGCRITAFLGPFPQRAILILLGSSLTVAAADVWYHGAIAPSVLIASALCVSAGSVVAICWNRPIASSRIGWCGSVVLGMAVVGFVCARFVPTLAQARSVHLLTARLSESHPAAPIVFFGERSHAAQLYLPPERIHFFPAERLSEFAAFVVELPESIVVTDRGAVESARNALSETHALIPTGIHEHLYLSRVEDQSNARVARIPNETVR